MTTKNAVVEQRKHPRHAVGLSLDIRAHDSSLNRATISDLSAGGMTFKTDADLEEGMTLHLTLDGSLKIRGEVRYARGPVGGVRRYGVRFHKIGYSAN